MLKTHLRIKLDGTESVLEMGKSIEVWGMHLDISLSLKTSYKEPVTYPLVPLCYNLDEDKKQ